MADRIIASLIASLGLLVAAGCSSGTGSGAEGAAVESVTSSQAPGTQLGEVELEVCNRAATFGRTYLNYQKRFDQAAQMGEAAGLDIVTATMGVLDERSNWEKLEAEVIGEVALRSGDAELVDLVSIWTAAVVAEQMHAEAFSDLADHCEALGHEFPPDARLWTSPQR